MILLKKKNINRTQNFKCYSKEDLKLPFGPKKLLAQVCTSVVRFPKTIVQRKIEPNQDRHKNLFCSLSMKIRI